MKIAIKALTASDLSFFKAHVERSKQKAINLNSDVFIDRFYPGLRGSFEQVNFPLSIIGPGGRAAHRLTRKALRSQGSKNWRLNGEFVFDPDGEPGRYDTLAVNDYGLLAFEGGERPVSVTLVLVSAASDPELHSAIAVRTQGAFSSRNTMIEVPDRLIGDLQAATRAAYAGEHPLDVISFRDTVEDVLFGELRPTAVAGRQTGRSVSMSPEELWRQLRVAEETGLRGEEYFGVWLASLGHGEDDFEWVSRTHARSAFDYEVYRAKWLGNAPHLFVDVKATRGPFERPLHMSISELRFAAMNDGYRIARLYEMDGRPVRVRMLTGVRAFAAQVLDGLGNLPAGVVADSVQIEPEVFAVEFESVLG
ncbi:hypothetical protein QEG98_00795 [Myxococcus sp. MxC21-1]|uniref:hypothetical protein n=1 Tax=Myxococcus sp. MxC21-1 TaxID=3041439 RepID=UPI00292DE44A|nr:hypothetical protein [Myxococcus sp. MxC21-1]WNZ62425.1 hypothetical protein QEG98_00795 [Myxococcus sp. MxC21-1]